MATYWARKGWVYGDISKGLPEMSDTKPFTPGKEGLHRFRNRFEMKNTKNIILNYCISISDKEAVATFPAEVD